jgi:hypothetical protein
MGIETHGYSEVHVFVSMYFFMKLKNKLPLSPHILQLLHRKIIHYIIRAGNPLFPISHKPAR